MLRVDVYKNAPTFPEDEGDEIADEDRWTDLQLAARDGDIALVETLLQDPSCDVNAPPIGCKL